MKLNALVEPITLSKDVILFFLEWWFLSYSNLKLKKKIKISSIW